MIFENENIENEYQQCDFNDQNLMELKIQTYLKIRLPLIMKVIIFILVRIFNLDLQIL